MVVAINKSAFEKTQKKLAMAGLLFNGRGELEHYKTTVE
jgi:hypothetical protein